MAEATLASYSASATYAGFWVRFLAVCIDLVLSAPFYYGLQYLVGERGWWADGIFCAVLIIAYGTFFSGRWQGTPGMYLLKFRITDEEGQRITFKRGLYWIFTSLISWAICFAGIIYLQSRFDLNGIMQMQFSCLQQNIAAEDCIQEIETAINMNFLDFQHLILAGLFLFMFLAAIWALSIALPRDKTGFHNLICRTRFLKGRPADRLLVDSK